MRLEREVRRLKLYALTATFFGAGWFLAFRPVSRSQEFDEVKAKRFLVTDTTGKPRVMVASNYKSDGSAGAYFFNRAATEAGALSYDGKRRDDGQVDAFAV